jgi:SAM-dependent methyltransferase
MLSFGMVSLARRPDDLLLAYYNARLAECGDTPQGAYWASESDRRTLFDVMLDVIPANPHGRIVLCDLGCGTGELLAHIHRRGLNHIDYVGVDRSALALRHARNKFPDDTFIEIDVNAVDAQHDLLECDYLVANGLFRSKFDLTHEEMWSFLVSTVERVWPKIKQGLAFNVMSIIVDSENDDLFHLPMDEVVRLLKPLTVPGVTIFPRVRVTTKLASTMTSVAARDTQPPKTRQRAV